MKRFAGALFAALALALAACSSNAGPHRPGGAGKDDGATLTVFATTGYLGDAVTRIAPEAAVTVMVKPGGDPHTYQPSTKDVEALRDADLVIWNGLYLEAMMEDQLRSLGDKQLAVGEHVDKAKLLPWPEKDHDGNDLYDPHIWNSPTIWSDVVDLIAARLSQAQPEHAEQFTANAAAYRADIAATAKRIEDTLASIPAAGRHLVTGHDAFQYYGATFGLDIRATDFVTSESQMSATQLDELASFIAHTKIPTIFQDNLKNPQAITSLKEAVRAKGWDVEVSDAELFADSLGDHAPVDTYLGVLEHNTAAIAAGLGATR